MEYIIIFGFALLVILPFIFYFFLYSGGTRTQISSNQVLLVARKVVDNAEAMYALGKNAKTSFRVYIPGGVTSSTISNNEVIFTFSAGTGQRDVAYASTVNISGTLPTSSGTYTIIIETMEGYVNVTYT